MGETIRLNSADGFGFEAYRAAVSDARRGGLVICHAVWGVTPHLRELADSYAQDGYEVLVPNLFARQGVGFAERDTDPALQARQEGFAKAVNWGEGVLDLVQAAIDALRAPVFLTGFCFGGTVAWLAASRCTGLSAASSFYGGQIFMFLDETPKVPINLHLGKHDPLIPPSKIEDIREAHPELPVYVYDAAHAFVAPSGYHEDSARLARLRTLALFSRSGGGRGDI